MTSFGLLALVSNLALLLALGFLLDLRHRPPLTLPHRWTAVVEGTRIDLCFPRCLVEGKDQETESQGQIPKGSETILLVEDEKIILHMTQLMLEGLGYRVLAVDRPELALPSAIEFRQRIDLLITDLVMPGINGRELAEQLQSHFPHLKTVFMSGYTADVIADHGILSEGISFIQKPFNRLELAKKLRQLL
jgi:CheY-like chemotaxis protein